MNQKIKDTLSNVCGALLAVSGAVIALQQQGVALPPGVVTGATITAALAGAIVAWLTGKPVK